MDAVETQERPAGLIDLTSLTLSDLWSLERDDVLEHSLRRVTAGIDDKPQNSVSAFNSAL